MSFLSRVLRGRDRVVSGEGTTAILRRAGSPDRVIRKRWHTGLLRKVGRAVLAVLMLPVIVPVVIYTLIVSEEKK